MQEYQSAVKVLNAVITEGKSMDDLFSSTDSALSKQISYGVIRDYYHLNALIAQLVKKPLVGKNINVHLLLLAGIYSVNQLNRPVHASVNAAVSATAGLKIAWAKGLVNGVLRQYSRNQQAIEATVADDEQSRFNHPQWLINRISKAWPDQLGRITSANNARPPMTLRVNQQRLTRRDYLALLAEQNISARPAPYAPSAIYLDAPISVSQLPEFERGYASVQDEASQLAAGLLAPDRGMRVLDACAAPGGKTSHLLESFPDISLTALDVDAHRLASVEHNLKRLGLQAQCVAFDLREFKPEAGYHRILLDAPCSATGIIRRHPDIKLLRRNSDIAKLAATQLELLSAAWALLEPGGMLVYSTCSILPTENEDVMSQFCTATSDAVLMPIDAEWGHRQTLGRQLLPDLQTHDGFYYARVVKAISS